MPNIKFSEDEIKAFKRAQGYYHAEKADHRFNTPSDSHKRVRVIHELNNKIVGEEINLNNPTHQDVLAFSLLMVTEPEDWKNYSFAKQLKDENLKYVIDAYAE